MERHRFWLFDEDMVYPEDKREHGKELVISASGKIYELEEPWYCDIPRTMKNTGLHIVSQFLEGEHCNAIAMRSSGQFDKDGLEIYEKDVLQDRFGKVLLCIEDDRGDITTKGLGIIGTDDAWRLTCNWEDYKIVGNILENKMLRMAFTEVIKKYNL